MKKEMKIWTVRNEDDERLIAIQSPFEYRDLCQRAGGTWSPKNQVWIYPATPKSALDICNVFSLRGEHKFSVSQNYVNLLKQADEDAAGKVA